MSWKLLPSLIQTIVQRHTPIRRARQGIRLAKSDHTEFIFDAHLKEAATGHFTSDYLHPHTHLGLRRQLTDSVSRHECMSNVGLTASRIYVYEDSGMAVAFCWVRETAGPEGRRQEIYAVYVHSEYRGHGIAGLLVRHVLKAFPESTEFSARLFPVSIVMKKIFSSMGFEPDQHTSPQTINLRLLPKRQARTRSAAENLSLGN
jgi:ribosomal protein S18 acetylase RimI-like enzyme